MPSERITLDAAGNVLSLVVIDDTPDQINAATLRTKAQQALTANATFLALAAPTNAQALAQTKTLTRECNALIRLLLHQLDDVSDT